MSSAVSNGDQPMGGTEDVAANGEDTFMDLNEGPKIRVVSNLGVRVRRETQGNIVAWRK